MIPSRRPSSPSGMGAGVPPSAPRCSALPPGVERPEPAAAPSAPTLRPAGPRRPGKPAVEAARPQPRALLGAGAGEERRERGANGRNTRGWEDPPPPASQPSSPFPLCCSSCSAKRLERNKSGNPPCPPRRETGER